MGKQREIRPSGLDQIQIRDIHLRSIAGGHLSVTAQLMGDRVTPKQAYELIVVGSDRRGNFTKRKVFPHQMCLDEVLDHLEEVPSW